MSDEQQNRPAVGREAAPGALWCNSNGTPLGVALARAHDRRREAAGDHQWHRPAYPAEWPTGMLDGPPWTPAGFDATLQVEVTVLGPGVRSRRPIWLVAPADQAVTS